MINHGFGVKLTTIDEVYLPLLRTWRNDPAVYTWCRQYDLIDEASHRAWHAWQAKDEKTRMYLVMDASSHPVGVCGLTSIDLINRRAEFSLYIAPAWGKSGLGAMALKTLLRHAFRSFGLNVVWGECFDGNPALALFESLGFQREGVRRQFYFRGGKYTDAVLISITEEEWAKKWEN